MLQNIDSKKILVIQTAFIGDAVLTLPMIQKLKEFYPENEIDVLAIPSTEKIFKASPYINEVLVMDKKGIHKSPFSLFRFSKEIRHKNYNKIFSPHRSFRTSLLVMQSRVRDTYGFDNSSLMHVYKNLTNYKIEHHEVQRNFDLIGFKYTGDEWRILPEIKTAEEYKEKVNVFYKNCNIQNNTAAIAPGSIWNTKIYPEEYYKKIIEFLIVNSFSVILIGGEKDKEKCDKLASDFNNNVISSAGKFNLLESIEILKRTKLLICNDSSPTHLGMCADIPVLTIYCSTSPKFGFYPYNKKSSYISFDDLFCKPCGIHGYEKCPINTFECAWKLKPEIVISKIKEILKND